MANNLSDMGNITGIDVSEIIENKSVKSFMMINGFSDFKEAFYMKKDVRLLKGDRKISIEVFK